MNNAGQMIQAARFRATRKRPYLATALWALSLKEKEGLETMAVDRWGRLYYNPTLADQWTVDEMANVMIHEVGHVLRRHAKRSDNLCADHDVWNKAADAEINDDLIKEGLNLPGNPVLPCQFNAADGLLAEEYYRMLKEQEGFGLKSMSQNGHGDSSGGSKDDDKDKDGDQESKDDQNKDSKHDDDEPDCSGNSSRGSGESAPAPPKQHRHDCGSCTGGERREWEDPEDAGAKVSDVEWEVIRSSVAEEIQKSTGEVPGHWKRWAEQLLNPVVDWRRELSTAIRSGSTRVGYVDYSYSKPNRRFRSSQLGGIVMPSLREPSPSVAVVVDTSGSIGHDELSRLTTEIMGIVRSTGGKEVDVLAVDTSVRWRGLVSRTEDVQLLGGGGTNMAVGINEAVTGHRRPDLIIVLTDGWTGWGKAPKIPVIVATTDRPGPTWSKTIKMKNA